MSSWSEVVSTSLSKLMSSFLPLVVSCSYLEAISYCKTVIFGGFLILAILVAKTKSVKYKSVNITAELNQGSDKMENLIFSIPFHETIYCGIQLESPQ